MSWLGLKSDNGKPKQQIDLEKQLQDLKVATTKAISEKDESIKFLKAQNATLLETIEKLKATIGENNVQIKEKSDELIEAKALVEKYKVDMEIMKDVHDEDLSDLNINISTLTQTNKSHEITIDKLNREVDSLKESCRLMDLTNEAPSALKISTNIDDETIRSGRKSSISIDGGEETPRLVRNGSLSPGLNFDIGKLKVKLQTLQKLYEMERSKREKCERELMKDFVSRDCSSIYSVRESELIGALEGVVKKYLERCSEDF